ncbi:MAG: bifunctional riboflavin kinase/FAD synthetase [Clostridiales bacterium]
MQTIKKNDLKYLNFSKGIGLGNFDGLHLGHMTLINTLIDQSISMGIKSMVYTFFDHPENVINKNTIIPNIINKETKIDVLTKTNLDYLFFEEFDEEFSKISPERFIEEILIKRLRAKIIVVGLDYNFGYKGKGNVEMMKSYSEKYDFKLIIIPPVRYRDEIISSTLIRDSVRKGNMKRAYSFLGRYFSIKGIVIHGKSIGRKLGFPTANILSNKNIVPPKFGVYFTKTLLNGKMYKSITNVGINPTFKDREFSIETFIFDFNNDIYGESIEIIFIEMIRDEIKFKNKDQLIKQIKIDVDKVKDY